ncbi:MAG: rhamnogalacturonan acetylesterase [Treponema sp.]|jgi:lysophospholipase L1-like esterase|nr:rhamnogalacturonan acetylesterase [Treponema sp.]
MKTNTTKIFILITLIIGGRFVSARPVKEDISNNSPASPVKIFLVGDSTVCDYATDPAYRIRRAGWGTYLQDYFDPSDVRVVNYALSGRSSKSFTTENNYRKLLDELRAGDYLFIQFGHNDEKTEDPDRGTDASQPIDAEGSFKWFLYNKYIVPAREKGVYPVLVTPVSRRAKDGGVIDSHRGYDDAVRRLSTQAVVPLIDLTQKTEGAFMALLEQNAPYGADATAALFAVKKDESGVDNTHFNAKGARLVCRLAVQGMREAGLPLVSMMKDKE